MLLSTISPQAAIFLCIVATAIVYRIWKWFFGGATVKQPFDDPSDWGRN